MPDTHVATDSKWIDSYNQFASAEFMWELLTPEEQQKVRESLGNIDQYGLWYEVVGRTCERIASEGCIAPTFDDWAKQLEHERYDWDID